MRNHVIVVFAVLFGVGIFASPSNANLIINTSEAAGSGTPTLVTGGGTLANVFDAAANHWEGLIQDMDTFDIQYKWAQLNDNIIGNDDDSTIGSAEVFANGDVIVSFDLDTFWFLDPTPSTHSEFGPIQTNSIGALSTGKYMPAASGPALTSFDLFSVALHEIGHGLAGIGGFAQPITVSPPRPESGLTILTTPTSHLSATYSEALMVDGIGPGKRRLVSDYDLLAVAESGDFLSISMVPEPSPVAYLALAGAMMGVVSICRAKQRQSVGKTAPTAE